MFRIAMVTLFFFAAVTVVIVLLLALKSRRRKISAAKNPEAADFIRQVRSAIRQAERDIVRIRTLSLPRDRQRNEALRLLASIVEEFDRLIHLHERLESDNKIPPTGSALANLICIRRTVQKAIDDLSGANNSTG